MLLCGLTACMCMFPSLSFNFEIINDSTILSLPAGLEFGPKAAGSLVFLAYLLQVTFKIALGGKDTTDAVSFILCIIV